MTLTLHRFIFIRQWFLFAYTRNVIAKMRISRPSGISSILVYYCYRKGVSILIGLQFLYSKYTHGLSIIHIFFSLLFTWKSCSYIFLQLLSNLSSGEATRTILLAFFAGYSNLLFLFILRTFSHDLMSNNIHYMLKIVDVSY